MLIGMEYLFYRKGPMTMGASQLCGFAKSDSSRGRRLIYNFMYSQLVQIN